MTDVRIQDFSENSKPDTNNDFLMTFNDNSESKTRLRDAFYAMVPLKQFTICKTPTLLLAVSQAQSFTKLTCHKFKQNWNQTLVLT